MMSFAKFGVSYGVGTAVTVTAPVVAFGVIVTVAPLI